MKKFFGIALLLAASSSAFAQEPSPPKPDAATRCTAAQLARCRSAPTFALACVVINNEPVCVFD